MSVVCSPLILLQTCTRWGDLYMCSRLIHVEQVHPSIPCSHHTQLPRRVNKNKTFFLSLFLFLLPCFFFFASTCMATVKLASQAAAREEKRRIKTFIDERERRDAEKTGGPRKLKHLQQREHYHWMLIIWWHVFCFFLSHWFANYLLLTESNLL